MFHLSPPLNRSLVRSLQHALFTTILVATLGACGGGGSTSPGVSTPLPAPLPSVDISKVAVADPGSVLPVNWQSGAFMEIFVRSYQDSNGDGQGDLRGLIQRLDYLKDLGVKGLWLMPVHPSQDRDHGYAVTDYRSIESAYGSLADLDELVAQAHARGMGVILDYVMNHSAAQHPLFINSAAATDNPYRSWYVWQSSAPSGWSIYGSNPWRTLLSGSYFAPFWDQMPDFNLKNATTVQWHQDNMRFWLNRGVDGFRFDAVGNLVENGPSAWEIQPENYVLMHDVRSMLSGYAKRYMVCEAPADSRGFGASGACGSAFAFDLSNAIIRAASGDTTALSTVANYFTVAPAGMATMLSNHDSFAGQRVWNQLQGNVAQYKLAAATYLLLPGTPFIYYGEEVGVGVATGLSGDVAVRTPMSWTADSKNAGFSAATPYRALSGNSVTNNVALQQADPNSLLNFYKAMLALRNAMPSLSQGGYASPQTSQNLLAFQRLYSGSPSERSLVVINYGTATASMAVAGLGANAKASSNYPVKGTTLQADATGGLTVGVPGQSVAVYTLTP